MLRGRKFGFLKIFNSSAKMKGKENKKADEFQIQKFYYQNIIEFLKSGFSFCFLCRELLYDAGRFLNDSA